MGSSREEDIEENSRVVLDPDPTRGSTATSSYLKNASSSFTEKLSSISTKYDDFQGGKNLYRLFGKEALNTILPFVEIALMLITVYQLSRSDCLRTKCPSTDGTSIRTFISHYVLRAIGELAASGSAVAKKKYNLIETTPLSFEWQPIDLKDQILLCRIALSVLFAVFVGEIFRCIGDDGLRSIGPNVVLIIFTSIAMLVYGYGYHVARVAFKKGTNVTKSGQTLMYHLLLAKVLSLVWEWWSAMVDITIAVVMAGNDNRNASTYILLFIEIVRTLWEFWGEIRKRKVSYFGGVAIVPIGNGALLTKLNTDRSTIVAGNPLFTSLLLTTGKLITTSQAIAEINSAVEATSYGPIGGASWRLAIDGNKRPSMYKAWLCIQETSDSDHIWLDDTGNLNINAVGKIPGLKMDRQETTLSVQTCFRLEDATSRIADPIMIGTNAEVSIVIPDGFEYSHQYSIRSYDCELLSNSGARTGHTSADDVSVEISV